MKKGDIVSALKKHGVVSSVLTDDRGLPAFILLESPDLIARGAHDPKEVVPIDFVKPSAPGELIEEIDTLIGLLSSRIEQLGDYKSRVVGK